MFRLFRDFDQVESGWRAAALTIGNFDGVHAGHRLILRNVVATARRQQVAPSVLTFDPHPAKIIAPARAPLLLTTIEERAGLMRAEGIEQVFALPFTQAFSELSADEFVRGILAGRLSARAVLIGENFRFGTKQTGDTHLLNQLGRDLGFPVEVVPPVEVRGRVVSSSEIRKLIQAGNVSLAGRLLDRPYALVGVVALGHGIGSKQTVPTLNLETEAEVLPGTGVYITRTQDLRSGRVYPSITNAGFRPTFNGDRLTIETFLLADLEGEGPRAIRVEFLRRVRDEQRFDSAEHLRQQILKDVVRARSYYRRLHRWQRASTAGLAR